jgi:F-type H+-transporting ATPase subunit epsilon
MILEIITPEANVFKGDVQAVQFPGKDGLFQVLENHAPIISALDKGRIKIDLKNTDQKFDATNSRIESSAGGKQLFVQVNGGVVEMMNNKIIVLAE